jgi:hypothetical protein
LYSADPALVDALNSDLAETSIEFVEDRETQSGIVRYIGSSKEHMGPQDNFSGNPLIGLLTHCKLMGKTASEKTVPTAAWSWDRKSCERFAAFLFETDGSPTVVTNNDGKRYPVISFYVTSRALAEQFRDLLERKLGILCGVIDTRKVADDVSVFSYADGSQRTSVRNHDLYGFLISTQSSVYAVSRFWRNTGCKAETLSSLVRATEMIYEAITGNRFHSKSFVGMVPTRDLEVDDPRHRFVLANGIIVSNSTRDAGDLGKQMNNVSEGLIVTEDDCGTTNGIPVGIDDEDNQGSLLARDTGPFKMGTPVTPKMVKELKDQGYDRLLVRSPTVCQSREGLCKKCVGLREDGNLPDLRQAIGVQASNALAERIAQGALNVKHSGGQKEKGEEQVYAGFDVINQLAQVPKAFRHAATLAGVDGEVTKVEPAPQGGTNVFVGDGVFYVEPDQTATVEPGATVEAGDQISTGIVNPAEVVKYKGIGEGRRYFAERFAKAFKDSKIKANRRNAEVLARALIDHVEVDDPEGLGDYLPGDVASYSGLAYAYKPRDNSTVEEPKNAIGKYLEQPALQYSIGTRVTNGMLKEFDEFGVGKLRVHPEPPTFTPRMQRLRTAGQFGNDWLAKLHGTYLKRNLLSDVQSGAESRIHGTHPVPGLAYGVEFGESRPGEVTY